MGSGSQARGAGGTRTPPADLRPGASDTTLPDLVNWMTANWMTQREARGLADR